MKLIIDIPEEEYEDIINSEDCGLHRLTRAIAKGIPFKENSEIKDLSKRVEILEKQIKEDKEEQLKKLEAELNYAKLRCALPSEPFEIKTVTNAKEAEEYPINEDIKKVFEEFTRMIFKQGETESEEK